MAGTDHVRPSNSKQYKWTRTFAIIATDANELVVQIHDRAPPIVAPSD